ncbi:unnamed protein product [Symbiodinium pilosum]|uniref:Uncharacterized protein n=1 Tax=Symbiodinium pilosum TaxID=2952 RepID=A0A812W178_SYMPI|nr:unnamed protein product [Symbiodinium pilosum]
MVDIWVHPRHGGLQEMILKERKWTAKAIEQRRTMQKDEKEAEVKIVKAASRPNVSAGAGSTKPTMETASLLKSRNGCLLPANVSCGPAAYYTGCGRYIR